MLKRCRFLHVRKYSWGICDIENPEHTDFLLLYGLVIGYLSTPCIQRTDTLYELYFERQRSKKLYEYKESQSRLLGNDFGLGFAVGIGLIGVMGFVAKKIGLFSK